MIAVSIARGRHRMMVAEHRHLAEQGAQLVELRLDYIVRSVNLKRLLTDRPCPVIVTCRRPQDGGKWERSEDERRMLLRSAIADGVDYVDLEEDIAGTHSPLRQDEADHQLSQLSGNARPTCARSTSAVPSMIRTSSRWRRWRTVPRTTCVSCT